MSACLGPKRLENGPKLEAIEVSQSVPVPTHRNPQCLHAHNSILVPADGFLAGAVTYAVLELWGQTISAAFLLE